MLIPICFMLGGFGLILYAVFYAFTRVKKGWSVKSLFKDFNRKIWMTVFLGVTFFSLYLIVISATALFTQQLKIDLASFTGAHLVYWIDAGLCTFAIFSLSIYFVRMFIKYLYLTRGKDN